MKFEFNITIHNDRDNVRLDRIENVLKEIQNDMANDFTALQQAQADHDAEIKVISDDIDELLVKLAQTPPSDQPAIDAITADIKASTAVLVAAATKVNPPAPTP